MADFLETVEQIRMEDASTQRLFGGRGERLRSSDSAEYMNKLMEAAKFLSEIDKGKRPLSDLQEALTTSDFPYLFGDILDRQMLANYRETPVSWPNYFRRASVRDFRTVKRFILQGGEGTLPAKGETDELRLGAVTDAAYSYAVSVFGRRIPISWKAIINDDLGALSDIPARLGKAARRTEEKFATWLMADSSGPHASVFTSPNGNKLTLGGNNQALSLTAVQNAIGQLLTRLDSDGEPIAIDRMRLVVPPQLQVTAYNIVNATQIWGKAAPSGGLTATQELFINNWVKSAGIIDVVTNFYLPIVSTSNGDTSWYLIADPTNGRPFGEMGFLSGFEEPALYRKAVNVERLGGTIDTRLGDFDTLSQMYSVVHVLGGAIMDPKMAIGSNGTGA